MPTMGEINKQSTSFKNLNQDDDSHRSSKSIQSSKGQGVGGLGKKSRPGSVKKLSRRASTFSQTRENEKKFMNLDILQRQESSFDSGDTQGIETDESDSLNYLNEAVFQLDQRQTEIDTKIRKQMGERQYKVKSNQNRLKRIQEKTYKQISMLINQLGQKQEPKPLVNPMGVVRTSDPSYNKTKQGHQGPGDVLIKLLQSIETETQKNRIIEIENEEKNKGKKAVINSIKAFQFGTGEVKEFSRDSFYVALEAFEKIYNTIIREDLEKKSKSRDFDFQSLLKLIRLYLQKIVSKFSHWGEKEKQAVDEIIMRTEKSYFANKLKKKFLSDKVQYTQMDVFKRLNEIEVVSLSRLFKQIKYMLLNRKESYISQQINKSQPVKLHLKSVFLDENLIVEARQREEERNNVGKIPKERSLPVFSAYDHPDEDHKKKVSLFAERYRKTSNDLTTSRSQLHRVDPIGHRQATIEAMKLEEKDREELDKYVDSIIKAFLTKYIYAMPNFDPHFQPLATIKEKSVSKKKKQTKDQDDTELVKNYKIVLLREDSDLQEHSETLTIATPKPRQIDIIKKKELVFEVFEKKKKDFVLHTNRYKRLPWQKQSLPSVAILPPPNLSITAKGPQSPTQLKGPQLIIERKGQDLKQNKSNSKKNSTTNRTTPNLRSQGSKTELFHVEPHYSQKRQTDNALLKLADSVVRNEVFMKNLTSAFRSKLSGSCIDSIAEQKAGFQTEMAKTIVGFAPKFAQEAISVTLSLQRKGAEELIELNKMKTAMAEKIENFPRIQEPKFKKK